MSLFRRDKQLVVLLAERLRSSNAEIVKYQQVVLDMNRHYLDLAREFRRSLDDPDPDVREKLDGLISDVSDHLARLEEFAE